MSNIKIISPQENLINVIASELTTEGKDYSKQIIIFPGKRPAHFLRKLLAERDGASIFPPKIFSIDEFVDFLYTDILGNRSKVLETIDATAILYEIHKKTEKRLGKSSYDAFDNFFPVALKLIGELEEVMMANQSHRQLRDALQNIEYEKFHSLYYYYEKFYEEVEKRHFVTRSMKYRTVANGIDKIDLSNYDKIIVAGFYAFTNVEKVLIGNLSMRENAVFIFQYGVGLLEQLKSLNFDLEIPEDFPIKLQEPAVHFYKASDTHGQVFALSAQIQNRLQRGNLIDHHTAIVLPSSEALFPTLHFPLSLLKESEYNIALGYPIQRTPAYGFLQNLLELVTTLFNGKFSAASYLRFVLHPYVKNIRFNNRSDITRIMFHQLEEYFAEEKSKTLLSLEMIEQDDEFINRCAKGLAGIAEDVNEEQLITHIKSIHNNTIRKFIDIKSIGDFARKAIDVLNYIFANSTANLHPYFRPYVQRLMESIDNISHSLLKNEKFSEPIGYLVFLKHYLASETVPFHGTPLRGLQVLGLLETRNLSFDTVYFIDANDDIIPGKAGENMLLPQKIRKMLDMETYHERERLIEYYFDLVVHNAKEVHLFYTENQKDGKKEKSRFVQKLLWKKQQPLKTEKLTPFEKTVHYRVNLANPKPTEITKTNEIVKFLRETNHFSASQLDTYLACQLKFYYQTVLGLREKDEVGDDVDALYVGTLIHSILEEYFKPFLGKKIVKEKLTFHQLEEVVGKMMEKEYGKDWLGPAYLMQMQIVNHLRQFIENYQIPIAEDTDIIIKDLEKKINVEKNGIKFTGKIDRIETRRDQIYIIDYKTSKDDSKVRIRLDKLDINDRETYREAIGSFQLPMYMLLYETHTGTPLDKITPAYLFLGRNKLNKDIEVTVGRGEDTPIMVFDSVEPVIFKLVAEIVDIGKPFTPTEFLEDECAECSYSTVCGTSWVRGRNWD